MNMKTTSPQPGPDAERVLHERQRRWTVGQQVIQMLGAPVQLQQLQVRPLWDTHYRVNVVVGADLVSARIAHSFFLTADDAGHIIACTPAITRHYEQP